MADEVVDNVNRNKDLFLEALNNSMGIVSTASLACGLSRTIHYRWLQEDKEYANKVSQIDEDLLDMAESALHINVKAKKSSDVQFFLKTKGKKRGYGNEVKVEGDLSINWNEEKTYEEPTEE